jgi:hypothetical protein
LESLLSVSSSEHKAQNLSGGVSISSRLRIPAKMTAHSG